MGGSSKHFKRVNIYLGSFEHASHGNNTNVRRYLSFIHLIFDCQLVYCVQDSGAKNTIQTGDSNMASRKINKTTACIQVQVK